MENEELEVKPFDLYLAGNPVHELKSQISQIVDQVAQRFASQLSSLVSNNVQVTGDSQITKTVLKSETDGAYFRSWIYFNNDIRNFGTIEINRPMMTRMIDLMCGGTGADLGGKARSDGPQVAEEIMVMKAIRMFFDSLESVYNTLHPFSIHMTTKAQDALFEAEKKIRDKEFIISSAFTVSVGELTGEFVISAPSYVIGSINKPVRDDAGKKSSERLEELMRKVSLPVSATLGRRKISLRTVHSLKPGDIIPLSEPLDAEVYAMDKYLLTAQVITDDHRLALQIKKDKPV